MKHLINYELSSFHRYMNEGTMSDIHLLAKEVKTEKEFISKFFKEYGDKLKQDKQSEEWVKSLYSDMNESVVTEASRWKGKEIFPTYVKPNDISGLIKKEKDLEKGTLYAILDLGMDQWQAEYEYEGKIKNLHKFKSTVQFANPDTDIEFTDSELKDALKNLEIAVMEANESAINEAKINKNAKRKVKDHKKVKPGMVAIDYNDDPYTVVGVGKASELLDFDDSGIAADEMDSDEDAIAIIGKGGYAVYSYMPDGAVVYESVVTEDNEQLFEATIEMAAMDPDNKDFLKFLKKNRVKIIDKKMEGPGGGQPVITIQGKRKDLETVLADEELGWADPDLAEYIEESVNEARGLSKKEVRDLKVKINNASTIGKFFTKDEVEFLQSLFESTINEAKKFYNTKEIVNISKLAGDIVLDAKDDIQDLAVIFGDKVPFNELEKVLTNYDLDFEDVNEARSQIKRKYGQYKAINVYEKASIRNNVLKFVRNRFVTEDEIKMYLTQLSEDRGKSIDQRKWLSRNMKYFESKVNRGQNVYQLSKYGSRVYERILKLQKQESKMSINESVGLFKSL